jgi:cellulose synthase/poly-beta-1,6-N-acetylglucosamine synthase-like glycosyltransferase
VIDKANGGKFDALNAGIALSSHPWFCCVDADTILLPDALDKMMLRVESDPTIIGLAGQVRVGNRQAMNRFWVPAQAVEYVRSFVMERIGWSTLQGLVTVPGAFSLFNKQAVCEVGGYSAKMPAEDVELVLKLYYHYLGQNRVHRIEYVPEAVAFTEVPTNLYSLARQRERWYRGLWIAICHHRHMLWCPRYKIVGLFVLPYLLFFELLWPVLGTIILLILFSVNLFHRTVVSTLSMFAVIFISRYLLTVVVLLVDWYLYRHCRRGQFGLIFWSSFLELSVFSILLRVFKIQAFATLVTLSSEEDGKWSTSRQGSLKECGRC